MKINKYTTDKKRTFITLGIITTTIIASIITYSLYVKTPNETLTQQVDDTSAVKESQVKTTELSDREKALNPQLPSKTNENSNIDKSNTNTPDSPPEKPFITRAEQREDMIKIAAILQQSSQGYCELQLKTGGVNTLTREGNITVGPSYYTCTFQIPRNELSAAGQWEAKVVHHIGNAHTDSNIKTLEVQ